MGFERFKEECTGCKYLKKPVLGSPCRQCYNGEYWKPAAHVKTVLLLLAITLLIAFVQNGN